MIRKLLKPLNFIVKKNKRYIYCAPHPNGKNDCYDLINYTADNLLCVINMMLQKYDGEHIVLFVERFDKSRDLIIQDYIQRIANKNITIKLLDSHYGKNGVKKYLTMLKNMLVRYRCKYLFVDTGYVHYYDKVKRQVLINFNYCTPFKVAKGYKKGHSFYNINYNFETSLMTAQINAAEFLIPLPNCHISGFPRNDYLQVGTKYEEIIIG